MNDNYQNDIWLYETTPPDFYAQVILTVVDHAPLLANVRLARLAVAGINACRAEVPGTLWAYLVLPDTLRVIVGPTQTTALDTFVTTLKARTSEHLLAHIRRADDATLDTVLRYNPVRGAPIYRVWQDGYHKTVFSTEYRLSNAIYDLQQQSVEAELVPTAAAWPYTWIGGQENE